MLDFAKKFDNTDQNGFYTFSTACSNFFGSSEFSAEMKATVACSFEQSNQNTIVPSIAKALYHDAGWAHGRLLLKLVTFIIASAYLGKHVSIVTTNYDTYLEDELAKRLSELSRGQDSVPGLDTYAFQYDSSSKCFDTIKLVRQPARGSAFPIELTYVHGRIAVDHSLFGTTVFSEKEYEESHSHTIELLCDLFRKGPTIIVGSSLVDTPLVRSLLQIKRNGGTHHNRFAVMKGRITGDDSSEYFQLARAEALGVEPLFYECYDDIPDIFSNLLALYVQGPDMYEDKLPCDCAIDDWITRAEFSRHISEIGYDLSATLVREVLRTYINENELLKIEFWFVDDLTKLLDGCLFLIFAEGVFEECTE